MKKNKFNIFIISIKRNLISIFILLFTFLLVVFSKQNFNAAKSGLELVANSVIPSLFPFFIATELIGQTNLIQFLEKFLNKFMKPLFNVPGCGAFALIMGILSGYPIGASIVTDLTLNNKCSKIEAERLLAFTNNSGPLFIIGTVGISFFGNSTIGILLLITHILASFTVGFIFRFWKKNEYNEPSRNYNTSSTIQFNDLGSVLSKSISKSLNSVFTVGGFVVLFSVILSILNSSGILNIFSRIIEPIFNLLHINPSFCKAIVSGFIELTNGLNQISCIHIKNISLNIILSAFILGFGGISVLLQVFSIISKANISIKPYFIGKLLHGIIASIYTYFAILFIPIFNFNI